MSTLEVENQPWQRPSLTWGPCAYIQVHASKTSSCVSLRSSPLKTNMPRHFPAFLVRINYHAFASTRKPFREEELLKMHPYTHQGRVKDQRKKRSRSCAPLLALVCTTVYSLVMWKRPACCFSCHLYHDYSSWSQLPLLKLHLEGFFCFGIHPYSIQISTMLLVPAYIGAWVIAGCLIRQQCWEISSVVGTTPNFLVSASVLRRPLMYMSFYWMSWKDIRVLRT